MFNDDIWLTLGIGAGLVGAFFAGKGNGIKEANQVYANKSAQDEILALKNQLASLEKSLTLNKEK